MLKCNNVNQRNWHTMTNGAAFYPCNWGLEPNELAVSCFTVNMSMTSPVTVCYHAVPFGTPHARSCLKFWAQEREQKDLARCNYRKRQSLYIRRFTLRLSDGRRLRDPHAASFVANLWVEASCCTKINPHQTMITTLRIDDVSRPMDVTNTSPLREHQGSYQRIYSVQKNELVDWEMM